MKPADAVAVNHFMSSQCYNCKETTANDALFCPSCNVIQPPSTNNFFNAFALKEQFELNLDELEQAYLELQTKLHPDLFTTKSDIEQSLALQHSILINNAYETLKAPLSRAEYLLKLQGIIVNQDNKTSLPPSNELLQEVLEIRMELEELEDKTSLQKLQKETLGNISQVTNELGNFFNQEEFTLAANHTIKLRYLTKIAAELDTKLHIVQ